jgi:hypothetical protein
MLTGGDLAGSYAEYDSDQVQRLFEQIEQAESQGSLPSESTLEGLASEEDVLDDLPDATVMIRIEDLHIGAGLDGEDLEDAEIQMLIVEEEEP